MYNSTPAHTMDVSHEGAFKRLVLERRGSYCFGHNGVFLGMLRALGYRHVSWLLVLCS
jgi:arylamine N-acetyltransferase